MQGVRFYEELRQKGRKGEQSQGTVVAIFTDTGRLEYTGDGSPRYVYDGVVAVQAYPNCPCASSAVSREYLDETCRRIPEARARVVHPQLFVYLDATP